MNENIIAANGNCVVGEKTPTTAEFNLGTLSSGTYLFYFDDRKIISVANKVVIIK